MIGLAILAYLVFGGLCGRAFFLASRCETGQPDANEITLWIILGALLSVPILLAAAFVLAVRFLVECAMGKYTHRARKMYRRAFQLRAIRLPGKFPWKQPDHLPFGTVLIDDPAWPIVADGKGGVTTFAKPASASAGRTR